MTEDLDTIKRLAYKWGAGPGSCVKDCPPEAKVISGRMVYDGQLYYFTEASGVELQVSDDLEEIIGYDIIDEQKFVWFKLKWA